MPAEALNIKTITELKHYFPTDDDTEGRDWLMRLARSSLGAVASINQGAIGIA